MITILRFLNDHTFLKCGTHFDHRYVLDPIDYRWQMDRYECQVCGKIEDHAKGFGPTGRD